MPITLVRKHPGFQPAWPYSLAEGLQHLSGASDPVTAGLELPRTRRLSGGQRSEYLMTSSAHPGVTEVQGKGDCSRPHNTVLSQNRPCGHLRDHMASLPP